MPLLPALALAVGVGVLSIGADALVRGAAGLAERFGLSPLVIGLTVVALGTSMPEVSVSIGSAISGDGGVALGNALGSNIFNILVVLGGSAIIQPLLVDRQLVRLDVPVMLLASVLAFVLALNGTISRPEGLLLLGAGALYTGWLVRAGLRTERVPTAEGTAPTPEGRPPVRAAAGDDPTPPGGPSAHSGGPAPAPLARQLLSIGVGLLLLVLGARLLVGGAESIARTLGVSELVIGLTVVAAGTSLPELATSFMAALRGQRDIAVGNAVGSNIFNALIVLGAAGVASGTAGVPVPLGVLTFDFPVMLATSVACLPIFFTGWSISRWEGWIFVGYYAAYLLYLVLSHTRHAAQDLLGTVLLFFALPLTALTLALLAYRQIRARRVK